MKRGPYKKRKPLFPARGGFVYVLSHPYMTCVKIGCTAGFPNDRADNMSRSKSVPDGFRVAHALLVDDLWDAERQVKKRFWDRHIGKEFFDVSADEVAAYMNDAFPGAKDHEAVEMGYARSRLEMTARLRDAAGGGWE